MNRWHVVAFALWMGLVACVIAPAGWAEEKSHQIQSLQYDPQTGELFIQNQDKAIITPEKVSHNPRRREIVFFIPNTTLQPAPQTVDIQHDPVVKSIRLEQRALVGVPAVRVTVHLSTNASTLPFTMTPVVPGVKLAFSRAMQPQGASRTAKVILDLRSKNPVLVTSKTLDMPRITMAQAVEPAASKQGVIQSVVGPVSEDAYSVIQDVFYENDSLTVVSKKLPITVERSFVLTEPNRYVVDISPAVLVPRSKNRAVLENNPEILNFKTGQLDEDTVRIVVQFAKATQPVDISRWENNRILKLTFGQ